MDKIIFAKKVAPHYVGEDCLQTMIGYKNGLSIISPENIIYHDTSTEVKINKYLTDERRYQFPYHNIPTHYQRVYFQKHKFTNQLLNFNTPYLHLSSDGIFIQQALKDNNDGIIVTEKITKHEEAKESLITREELDNFFDFEENKLFKYKGNIVGKLNFPNIDQILEKYKNEILENYKNIIYNLMINEKNQKALEILVNKVMPTFNIQDIPNNFDLLSPDENILMIKTKDNIIELTLIDVKYVNENCYKLITKNVPVILYTLEEVKKLKTFNSTEPNINIKINPDITKNDITNAKKLVLKKINKDR